ncbi:MAG: hypothetical protein JWN98_210 [Abditibacteriota bacterium]|nr:hypothetical protein [Abditibacteriota bacterium]
MPQPFVALHEITYHLGTTRAEAVSVVGAVSGDGGVGADGTLTANGEFAFDFDATGSNARAMAGEPESVLTSDPIDDSLLITIWGPGQGQVSLSRDVSASTSVRAEISAGGAGTASGSAGATTATTSDFNVLVVP